MKLNLQDPTLQALFSHLSDAWWRICNLYFIKDKDGNAVPFRPNKAQRKFYKRRWLKNHILKARQLGMSTFIAILILDALMFNPGLFAGVIDKTLPDAKAKLEKMRFAYQMLDHESHPLRALGAELKRQIVLTTDAKEELRFSNGSAVWCGVSLRGGTTQMLWISELGSIAFKFPAKAEEIRAGALNTVAPTGQVFIESTHEGGRHGMHYELLCSSMLNNDDALTGLHYRFHFFPWWEDEDYQLPGPGRYQLRPEMDRYFHVLEAKGILLTEGQKAWYDLTQRTQGAAMKREYPSTPDEAFEAPIEGAIYGDLIAAARAEGRICRLLPEPGKPLFSFWDIGMSDQGALWLVQPLPREILVLDHYRCAGQPASHYADQVRAWEDRWRRPIARHFLPHDADTRERSTGETYLGTLKKFGLTNAQSVPRTPDVWLGINHLRDIFPKIWFHEDLAEPLRQGKTELPSGIACLEGYRVAPPGASGVLKDAPLHDWTSHAADALRTFAEAHRLGLLRDDLLSARPKIINPLRR